MGHFLFVILHLVAVTVMPPALVITIPLHLIYTAVKNKNR